MATTDPTFFRAANPPYRTLIPSIVADAPNSPRLIRVPSDVAAATGNSQVIFLGDQHNYTQGHEAIAKLMSEFKREGVTAMALEMAPSMTKALQALQDRIVREHLTVPQVDAIMKRTFQSDVTGLAGIVVAASQNNIRLTGIDVRLDDPSFNKRLDELEKQMSKIRDPKKREELMSQFLLSKDREIAQQLVNLVNNQPTGGRVAVMFGEGHGRGNNVPVPAGQTPNHGLLQNIIDLGMTASNVWFTSPKDHTPLTVAPTTPAPYVVDSSAINRVVRKAEVPGFGMGR